MQTPELFAHPAHRPTAVQEVKATLDDRDPHWLRLRWRIEGAREIVLPPFAGRRRRDGLWLTTCAELFAAPTDGVPAYREFNFSPSEAWNSYDFAAPRVPADNALPMVAPPVIAWRGRGDIAIMDVALPRTALPGGPLDCGITAVIDEGGQRSYWALAHGGTTPDFHDRTCCAAQLAPPARP